VYEDFVLRTSFSTKYAQPYFVLKKTLSDIGISHQKGRFCSQNRHASPAANQDLVNLLAKLEDQRPEIFYSFVASRTQINKIINYIK